jgi:NADP-dependent 3-hydroxy acid dehydrogenase YdfG
MTLFEGRFQGQTAVITGAGSGIGLAVAQRLSSEGAQVSGWDISEAALRAAGSALAHSVIVDQSDENEVARATEATLREFGGIDILVVSAGITGPNVPLVEYPTDAWRQVMAVNVNGPFYVNRAIVPHMMAKNYGRIVNIASVAGKEGNPNASAYSSSKAAVIGMTKSLGKGIGSDRHIGERRDASGRANSHLRPNDPSAHRFHAVEDSGWPLRDRRRECFADRLAREPGMFLFDRSHFRHFRRSLDLLERMHI